MDSIYRYFKFVRPYWKMIAITIVIGIIKFGIPLTLPLLLKYVVDDLLTANISVAEKTSKLSWLMGAAFFLFIVLRGPIEYYRQYFAQLAANRVLYDIRDVLFAHMQKLSLRFYHQHKAGEVISRVINDVEQTKNFVLTGLMNIWLDMVTLVIAIGIMFYFDVKLTLVSIAVFPLYGLSVKFFYKRLRKLTKDRSQSLAELQGHLHERVQGVPVIQSFTLETFEQRRFEQRNGKFLDKALAHTRWNAHTFAVVNTIADIAPLLVIFYAGYQVIHESMTIGTMIAFYGYLERLYSPLRRLVNSSTSLTQSIASMDRVLELLDEPYDIKDQPHAQKVGPVRGEITFDNVYFKYQESGDWTLKGITLPIAAGETVAFVGMSGGGKSSLVSLIPRFYDVQKGAIFLDGIDIREITQHSLRDQIGMVLQDAILFSGSIIENIRMGRPEATMEEVIEAAKSANADEFISEFPMGYETEIGERGVKLSGGQKQRLAIARVFLKNPRIFIFDEATSALDLESEQAIQQAVDRLARDRTTLIVAHRLSTITHVDRIVLMEDGEIKEIGTHLELMERKGLYYKLFTIQDMPGLEKADALEKVDVRR